MEVYAAIRYDRVRQIGAGQGMNSTVYLAEDPHLRREIAVKEIDRTKIKATSWDEYHQEAQAMFASRHDHVVPIYYACLTTSHLCLAMPYYQSGSLLDRIRTGPLPLGEAYRIADGILAALAQVHAANLLHFDLKPSNVLFSNSGRPLVADFGQARLMDPLGLSAAPPMYQAGTPPEVITHGLGTVYSDIYQAGLTLYRMFNGDPFFKEQIHRLRRPLLPSIQSGRLPDRRKFLPHVPAGIRRVVRKALRVDPGERHGAAAEFQDALGRVEVLLDWRTDLRPGGEVIWRANRDGKPGLEVRQLRAGSSGRWKVEVYTVQGAAVRRKGVEALWANALTSSEVDQQLGSVFSALGSG